MRWSACLHPVLVLPIQVLVVLLQPGLGLFLLGLDLLVVILLQLLHVVVHRLLHVTGKLLLPGLDLGQILLQHVVFELGDLPIQHGLGLSLFLADQLLV